ncbi:radical SAM family heme chaperone HemW [Helicobacter canadensis]|uniref:Heme chaperone HemW n=1 Tax=Helicobacter canadensis MIT 98-5491 TaxID=537970 RepID=C5ZYH4_9HELI|nr:radical SAM family heme chaperone HemW [Helicobacter canadensis]EES90192.1 Oxygen-independent coproporphyrinogen III oxidase-like protein BU550 [Helicobacter canadensis MIT 98-5491]EFR49349.1 putative oxygen-independent coproporphyrinogen III oxidase [Helicobacter canadensis MIT 98-5491]STP02302.1 coproporphyrinogen III oxidase [Helicobacter canadensis]
MEVAVYLHIPFCDSKCGYCAFNSKTNKNHLKEQYMQTLVRDLQNKLLHFGVSKVTSLYIGGGTPSVVESRQYRSIFKILEPYFTQDIEINIEANPNSLSLEWIRELKQMGVNRLSLGVQSFFVDKLRFLERNHRVDSVFEAIDNATKVGLENLSIDLIYGTPFCNQDLLKQEIQMASKLPINHISAYQLSIDEGSRFFTQKKQEFSGEFAGFASMGHFVREELRQAGFLQYEVSNYSRGYQSKHNLAYWEQKDYLGVGAGGVGCIAGVRSYGVCGIEDYLKGAEYTQETLSQRDLDLEHLFLGFRSCIGVLEDRITKKKELEILLKEKKVEKRAGRIYAKDYFLGDELALFLW